MHIISARQLISGSNENQRNEASSFYKKTSIALIVLFLSFTLSSFLFFCHVLPSGMSPNETLFSLCNGNVLEKALT